MVASIRDRDTDGEEQDQLWNDSQRGADNTSHEAAQSSEAAEPKAGMHDLHIPELHKQVAYHRSSVLRVHVLGETPQAGAQASRLHSQNTGTVQTTAKIKGTRDRMGEIMTRDLLIHTLQMMRSVYRETDLETETEALDAAIWALQTQEQLMKERDAAMAMAQPEIIRCKECVDYDTSWIPHSAPDRYWCPTMDSFMPEDGYCNFAERRTDG